MKSNPRPDERGVARDLAAAGIDRLSLGAQAFESGLLRRLGRRHRAPDVAAAVAEARDAGIASVSVDLLYDVPGQSEEAWAASVGAAIALGVDHVSAYALTLDDPDEEGLTGLLGDHLPTKAGARRWREAAARDQDDDVAAAQYALAVERFAAAGTAATRSPTGDAPGTRAGTTSSTGGGCRTRRWAWEHTRSTVWCDGGTRRGWTGTSGRSRRSTDPRPPCRRVGPRRSRPPMPPQSRRSSLCAWIPGWRRTLRRAGRSPLTWTGRWPPPSSRSLTRPPGHGSG